jgi:hypothetical protein
VGCTITFELFFLSNGPTDSRLSILDASCEVNGENPFGQVSEGTLLIKGACLGPFPIEPGHEGGASYGGEVNEKIHDQWPINLLCGKVGHRSIFYPDSAEVWDNSKPSGTILLVIRSSGGGLMLRELAEEAGAYNRIGVAQLLPLDGDMTKDWPIQTVKII